MAEIAKGIIDIEINTGSAASELKALQAQINAFSLALNKNNGAQAAFTKEFSGELQKAINKTGLFTAETIRLSTAAATLDKTLSKGKTSLGQFFSAKFNKDSAIAAETMALASERAKRLQTQFIATAGAANGFQDALAVRPLAAFSSEAAVAAQRTQILSNMFKQGTTQLINFGKNVQWAGRQLMVGFTVPLTIFGAVAGKTFMELEKQAVAFKKVYGDIFTTPAELNKNLEAVKGLASEYTKYGIAVKDTISLAAQAAAAGRKDAELTDAVSQATRLATLGQMDQNAALETTISLQSAFRLSGKDLADTINFLNMVENQTVVSLQDIAAAIPRVAPVIQGLGGDVKDLTVFLAAMQEGGVDAAEGANALKSGLASLINPTKQATEMLNGMGINLETIIQANRGDLMGTVRSFAEALQGLDQFSRQQALEQVFGKFQYAKLGALFENISREGSQAQQVIATMGYSTEQLGATADKELKTIEESFGVQLTGAVERFKLAIAPIGEIFVRLAIPLVNLATKFVESFNGLSDGQKRFAAIAAVIVGVVIPAVTMMAGLFLNLVGTLAKIGQGMALFGKGFITGGPVGAVKALTQSSKYLSLAEMDAAMAAQQLSGASKILNSTLIEQAITGNAAAAAINNLTKAYSAMAATQAAAGTSPSFLVAGAAGAAAKEGKTSGIRIRGLRRNSGGGVPGVGNTDTVPAMLTPGEFVVNKEATKNNLGLLKAINGGNPQKLNKGGMAGVQYFSEGDVVQEAINRIRNSENPELALKFNLEDENYTESQKRQIRKAFGIKEPSQKEKAQGKDKNKNSKNKPKTPEEKRSASKKKPTFSHMQRNLVGGKDALISGEEATRIFDEIARTGDLTPLEKAYAKSLKPSGYAGSRITGNLGFDISSYLNAGVNDLDDLINDLEWRKQDGNDPYKRMLLAAGVPEQDLAKVSDDVHKRVTMRLKAMKRAGITTFRDVDLYPHMEKVVPMSIKKAGYGVAAGKLFAMSDVSDAKAIRWGGMSQAVVEAAKKIGLNLESGKVSKTAKYFNLKGLTEGTQGVSTRGTSSTKIKAAGYAGPLLSLLQLIGGGIKRNSGGPIPGSGNSDTVPAMLTPGEFVVNKKAASQNQGMLEMINGGKVKGYALGGIVGGAGSVAAMGGMATGNMPVMVAGTVIQMLGPAIGRLQGSLKEGAKLGPALKNMLPVVSKFGLGMTSVAGGLALAGFAIYKLNKQIGNAEKSGAEFTNAMYGTSKTIEGIAEQFGTQTNAQAARIAAVERIGGQAIGQEAQQKSAQFVESDAGKQMLKDVGTVKAGGGNAVEALKNQLSAAIISGAIGTEEARAIAVEVGTALGDQSIAVGVSGELTRLMGPDGGDLLKNLSSITAEISPRIDANKLAADASSAYEKMNAGEKFIQSFQGGEADFVKNYQLNEVSAANSAAFAKETQARELLNLAYQEGTISLKEFQAQSSAITKSSEANQDMAAKALGFENQSALVTASQGTAVSGGRGGGGTVRNEQQKQAQSVIDAQKKEVEDLLLAIPGQTEDTVAKISASVSKLGAGAFGDILSGRLNLADVEILVKLKDGGLTEKEIEGVNDKLQALKLIPDIDNLINVKTTSQEQITDMYDSLVKFQDLPDKELNIYAKDNFTEIIRQAGISYDQFAALPDIEKRIVLAKMDVVVKVRADFEMQQGSLDEHSRSGFAEEIGALMQSITSSVTAGAGSGSGSGSGSGAGGGGGSGKQTLAQYIKEFKAATKAKMDFFKATNHLLGTEKQEALALIDTAMYLKANAAQRKTLIALAEKQLKIQRATAFLAMSAEEKTLLSLEMQEKALDVKAQGDNKALRGKQREMDLNNRALDDLAEKEDAVNKTYDAKLEALDKIATANDRLAEQERSRIGLASALASGDIAGAASAVSEMQQKEAQYQIEDAQAALEAQRERDLESLTVSVNGQLLTREQIQARNKTLANEIETIEDRLFNIETQRLDLAEKRARAELRTYLLQQKQTIEALKYKEINGELTKTQKAFLGTLTLDFNNLAKTYNDSTKGSAGDFAMQNRGGYIARMANGGIAYKGSREAPPALRMNDGFTVPGNGMTDKVPALLTPGEFVVRKSVADKSRGFLEALNGQVFPGMGGAQKVPTNNFLDGIGSPRYSIPESGTSNIPVASTNVVSTSAPMYNSTYNVNVNVSGTNASPDDIANVVMAKLSQQNRGNLRSSRY